MNRTSNQFRRAETSRRTALKQAINWVLGASLQEEKSFPLPEPAGSRLPSSPTTTSDPFKFFEVIYCINLDRRQDRWEAAMRQFTTLGIFDRVERVAGDRGAAVALAKMPISSR